MSSPYKTKCFLLIILLTAVSSLYGQLPENQEKLNHEEMVLKIISSINNENIGQAFLAIPRHKYVPDDYQDMAYMMVPIPLDDQKILPAPDILAMIFNNAELNTESKVLLIGSSCSYSASILSLLCAKVFVLDKFFRRVQNFENISVKRTGNWNDWLMEAPFDFIFLQDAVRKVPSYLYNQLKPGGILIFPLLTESGYQTLIYIKKDNPGLEIRSLGDCFFTPVYQ